MDLLSRIITKIEDRREMPRVQAMHDALGADKEAFDTMGLVCRRQAARIPDRIALRFEDGQYSYGEYNEGVNRYAHLLRERGVVKGDVVNLMMLNSAQFLMAQGACAKLGAISALINHHIEGDALVHVHQVSGAKLILADTESSRSLAAITDSLCGLELHGDASEAPELSEYAYFRPLNEELVDAGVTEPDLADVTINDVFLYVYTSGTTGFPKPAIVRHMKFSLGGRSLAVMMGQSPDDCMYAPTPLYHGWANFVGFSPAFHTGACFSSRRKFSASEFLPDVRQHKATMFAYVGELCRYLMHLPPSAADRDHSLRLATGAGLRADIWREFMQRFGIERIIDTYGQTEGNISLQNFRGRVGSVGRCAPGGHEQLRLARYDRDKGELQRDASGRLIECRVGEVGELVSCISKEGSMPFDGYANPEKNQEKIIYDCFEEGDRFIRSGDLLRRDRASYYYFVDRIGDTFRWKGENVATLEVEHLLNKAPGIQETAVYGVHVTGYDGRAGMVVVIPRAGVSFNPTSFYEYTAKTLPAYARPQFVRLAKSVDITGNFKHRKQHLQGQGYDPSVVTEPLFFRDDKLGSFVVLDAALYADIAAGHHRL